MLLYLSFQKDIHCPIYKKCGTQNRTRFVNTSKLTWSLGDSVFDSQIGLHAFTGYDTVSAFASRGKLSSLKLMKRDITYQETFSHVGQTWVVQPHLFEKVQQFTWRMNVAASSTTEVNDLRYLLCERGRDWVQSATTMQRMYLHAPPSSQLLGSKLEVLFVCSSRSAQSYQVWMVRWWWQAHHSLDAVATSTIVGVQVCPFL